MTAPSGTPVTPGSAPSLARSTSLWRSPVIAVAGAFVLEFVTSGIDRWIIRHEIELPRMLERGSPDDIRSVLSTIASATITTLALVLSITMVVLTLAATQFGPRLITTFLRSGTVKVTIGVFAGVFVYSLLVLDSVTTGVSPDLRLSPDIGTTVALVGAIASVFCLIWYAHDVARGIQLPVVVEGIYGRLQTAIADTRGDRERAAGGRDPGAVEREWLEAESDVVADSAALTTTRAGYLQQIEYRKLMAVAAQHDAIVVLSTRPGDFLAEDDVLALVHPAAAVDAMKTAVETHVDLGPHRTLDQDLEFAIDQMVEIALRALSPAINDTFTGLTCLDWLGSTLRSLATIPVDRSIHCDAAGRIRIVERGRSTEGLVRAAYSKIRQSAAGNPAVAIRLIDSITTVAMATTDDVAHEQLRSALAAQAHMTVTAALGSGYTPVDRDDLLRRYHLLTDHLGETPVA